MAKDRHSTLGTKLGPRIAQLNAQAHVAAERGLLDTKHKLAMHVFEDASNMIGGELAAASGDLLKTIADHPATTPHMARLLKLAYDGKGQGGAITAAQLLGGAASSSLGTIFSNELYPAIAHIVGGAPHIPPGTETLALLVSRGIVDFSSGNDTAAGQGMPTNWFEHLVEGSRSWPDVPVILELWRRGEVDDREASHLMQRIGLPAEVFKGILSLKRQYLAPADAALGLLRGALSPERAAEVARVSGMTEDDFKTLELNTGEPPALEELLMLWRRGKIDTAKLDKGIRQSRVRDEWTDTVHLLSVIPPSPPEVLTGLLKGQISRGEAEKRWKEAGGDPTWFQHAFDTEGSSPSPVELGTLANRKIIPWDGLGPEVTSFEQGFREGAWRDKWHTALRRLAVYYPPPRTLPTLVSTGAVDKREAIELLRGEGVTAKLAEGYLASATAQKLVRPKELAEAQISKLFTDQAISADEAHTMWKAIGYDEDEAKFLAELANFTRVAKEIDTAVSTIHSRYTSHVIEKAEAASDLDQLKVPPGQRDQLLRMWALERKAKVKLLTAAEVRKGMEKSLLTEPEAEARLVKMGYPQRDAEIFLQL